MSRLTTFRLETNRLALSHLSHDDCEFILGLVNEPAFKRYIGDRQVHNMEDARVYLEKGAIGSYGLHGFGLYRVGLKPDGTPLGICGLVKREEFEHPDLGFAFREQYWENGYAYESCMATIEHARRDLGLEQIIAIVDGDNDSSIRLLRKLGFRFAEMIRMPGEPKDICRYALDLQSSWCMRPATADDAAALSRLAFRSKASWGYDDAFMVQCRNELTYSGAQINSSASEFQVCTMNGEILGFYALEQIDRVVLELEALFVEPGFIGKGIGRFMLEHARQLATSRGAERIVIQGDPHAEPFYLAAGAVICGTRESASIAGRLLPLYELHLAKKPDTGRNQ